MLSKVEMLRRKGEARAKLIMEGQSHQNLFSCVYVKLEFSESKQSREEAGWLTD